MVLHSIDLEDKIVDNTNMNINRRKRHSASCAKFFQDPHSKMSLFKVAFSQGAGSEIFFECNPKLIKHVFNVFKASECLLPFLNS